MKIVHLLLFFVKFSNYCIKMVRKNIEFQGHSNTLIMFLHGLLNKFHFFNWSSINKTLFPCAKNVLFGKISYSFPVFVHLLTSKNRLEVAGLILIYWLLTFSKDIQTFFSYFLPLGIYEWNLNPLYFISYFFYCCQRNMAGASNELFFKYVGQNNFQWQMSQ